MEEKSSVRYTTSSLMQNRNSHHSPLTTLDLTPEKKELQLQIQQKETHFRRLFRELERLRADLEAFTVLYDAKIGRLYSRLNALDNLLFKYQHISEYVDDILSFTEAQNVYEDTMSEQRKRMTEEFKKRNKAVNSNSKKNNEEVGKKEELKRLYRNLAALYHPDKKNGNQELMKRINTAYKEGNLFELRALGLTYVPLREDATLLGLRYKLRVLSELIAKANKEKNSIRRSDLFALMKKTQAEPENATLTTLANNLLQEIERKEKEVQAFVTKFGIHSLA